MSKLADKIYEHTKKTKKLYLPYLWKTWGVEPEVFTKALCEIWNRFENPRIVNNLLHTEVKNEPVWYEVCDGKYDRGGRIHRNQYWEHCLNNNKEDQHISIFAHGNRWVKNYEKMGSVSCSQTIVGMDYLYLELDRETLEDALEDATKFYIHFPFKDYITLWYSGNNSVHIQIDGTLFGRPMGDQSELTGRGRMVYNLAHDLSVNMRHEGVKDPHLLSDNELFNKYLEVFGEVPETTEQKKHEIRQKLENIDPNLFSVNSVIRQPYSIHEKGRNLKKIIPPGNLMFGLDGNSPKKKLDFYGNNSYIENKPKLIHKVYENYECKIERRSYDADVDEDEVIRVYSKAFKYFSPKSADKKGWVNGLYSPFYKDTNPSVCVNINTGFYIDFGEPSHKMSFEEFKNKYDKN